MREIKFRAWDGHNHRMIERPFVVNQDGRCFFEYIGGGTVQRDVVLMQFTGLLDRNGKEIYQGDWMPRYHQVPMKRHY